MAESDSDASELRLIKEERLSTEKCLQICAQLSEHINQIQITRQRRGGSPKPVNQDVIPDRVTNEGLQECKNSLILTAAKLEKHIQDLMDRLLTKSKAAMTSEEEFTDLERLRDEWETTRQCMDVCSRADSHLKENISIIDNYATGDAVQFMVSTDGNTVHGKNRGLGWRSRQVGGHLSDASLQQLSRDLTSVSFQDIRNEGSSSRSKSPSIPDDRGQRESNPEFRERYGRGFQLSPKTTPDMPMSSTGSAEEGGLKR